MKLLKTILALIVYIYLSDALQAQADTIKIAKPKPVPEKEKLKNDTIPKNGSSFDLYYGYKFFTNNFENKFNTLKNFNINCPIQLIGIGGTGPGFINRTSRSCYLHMLYNQVIPQPLLVNDTIKCKITGFVYSLAMGGYLHTKSNNFYFSFYGGFNTGRLRFLENEIVRQKNPFFSPKIGIQSKLQIKKFTINIIVEAEYDISKTSWRRMVSADKNKIDIDRFKQTGYTALVGISYKLIKYVTYKDDRDDNSE